MISLRAPMDLGFREGGHLMGRGANGAFAERASPAEKQVPSRPFLSLNPKDPSPLTPKPFSPKP